MGMSFKFIKWEIIFLLNTNDYVILNVDPDQSCWSSWQQYKTDTFITYGSDIME